MGRCSFAVLSGFIPYLEVGRIVSIKLNESRSRVSLLNSHFSCTLAIFYLSLSYWFSYIFFPTIGRDDLFLSLKQKNFSISHLFLLWTYILYKKLKRRHSYRYVHWWLLLSQKSHGNMGLECKYQPRCLNQQRWITPERGDFSSLTGKRIQVLNFEVIQVGKTSAAWSKELMNIAS